MIFKRGLRYGMCGITGFIDYSASPTHAPIESMISSLAHRGPNDRGRWFKETPEALVALGHTRLSILDLSNAGRQPMQYEHLTLVYNGEIYNFKALRKTLAALGHRFITESDTEVVLHAFAQWGPKAIERFIGMFAFALFDANAQRLYFVRDRVGVKPFYYYESADLLVFGSELKALMAHPRCEGQVNTSVLGTYFDLGYVPGEHSIYKNTKKLPPGHYLTVDLSTHKLDLHRYWSANECYTAPKATLSFGVAKAQLHELLKSACSARMVSDVPVGVFLSGGYDSSAVTALLQAETGQRIKTFTIGFETGNNEAPYARDTADYLGTLHHEYICTTKEAQEIIPDLADIYDEPFADSSAIPTVLVSRFAKQHVSVALSADGGDETFAGYHDYAKWRRYTGRLEMIPKGVRPGVAQLAKLAANLIPRRIVHRRHQLESVSASLNAASSQSGATLYTQMRTLPSFYRDGLINHQADPLSHAINQEMSLTDPGEHPMLADYLSYLPDDILVKVDRASMSTSLEARDPLLDHRLLEFAARLPLSYKANHQSSKRILKDIVHEYLPKRLLDRPKRGFSIPLKQWLKGDLRPLLMDTLSPDSVRRSGLLNAKFVSQTVKQFEDDSLHYTDLVWKIFMLQLWSDRWL
jgi:asparagine synthase (glutamine-hydrolysing)